MRRLIGHGATIYRMAFDTTERRLATTSNSGEVIVWDVASGRELRRLAPPAETRSNSVAFSPDGRRLYIGHGDGRICFHDLELGELVRTVFAHISIVGSIEVSRDGRRLLISGWYDGEVYLWSTETGQKLLTIETGITGLSDASFGNDETSVIAAGMNGGLRVWRL